MERENPSALKKLLPLAGALAVAGTAVLLNRSTYAGEPLPTVAHVDLKRYQGTWYEIARLPLYWENKCDANVTATYTLRPDGKVTVLNQCLKKDGSETASTGTAEVATRDGSNAKLKVSFFWPFKGDYWILSLDSDYCWALVGTPNLKSLWVLSRMPQLDATILDRLLDQARQLGFDTEKLIYTRQTSAR
ncbi:MAG: lipocalin family protein [Edaphobacter sp.]|uniref:lipocalin family protein n=1 Tax=Edaphobacter sp. TaxID=1934404 RepID=UPI002397AEB2|nr:lipocalin family protein [Edaphobacter sp.]MDE1178707.1 lipocalin family protein [Edaphobacter sp.]